MDERKLLLLIKNHPEVYNPYHKNYRRLEARSAAWAEIAQEMNEDVEICHELYLDLRLQYQNFVRKLRRWFKAKIRGPRPKMEHEKEMLFLWRFISDKCFGRKSQRSRIKVEPKKNIESVKPEIVAYYKKLMNKRNIRKLLTFVEEYPEIYDSSCKHFGNPHRMGIMWNCLSEELGEKSWKCIKTWIHLKFEYEYLYTMRQEGGDVSQLEEFSPILKYEKLLSFLNPHIDIEKIKSSRTYKLAPEGQKYIRTLSTNVDEYIFLNIIKQYPQLHRNGASNLPNLSDLGYSTIWLEVAKRINQTPCVCEQTWVILKTIYEQITTIQKGGNPLNDKWESQDLMDIICRNGLNSKPSAQNNKRVKSFSTIYEKFVEKETEMAMYKDKLPMWVIEHVKKYPQLYKKGVKKSRSNEALWSIIGKNLNISGEICKQLWLTLECLYKTYTKKKPSESAFPYYKAMSFLNESYQEEDEIKVNKTLQKYFKPPFDTKESLAAFINEVKKFPFLYDHKDPMFWSKHIRVCCFKSLGKKFKCSRKDAEIVWSKIKLSYCKYVSDTPGKASDIIKMIEPIVSELEFLNNFRYTPSQINDNQMTQTESVSASENSNSSSIEYIQNVESTQNKDDQENVDKQKDPLDINTLLCPEELNNDIVDISSSTTYTNIEEIEREEQVIDAGASTSEARCIDAVNTLIFMATVRKYPVIYDPNEKFFYSKLDRLNAWNKISLELKCSLQECDAMWNSVVQRFLKYKEVDPDFKLPVNSKFWKDMIYMYTRKTGQRESSDAPTDSTEPKKEEFDPTIHTLRGSPSEHFRNLALAADSLPTSVKENLFKQIENIVKKKAEKYDDSVTEVICLDQD